MMKMSGDGSSSSSSSNTKKMSRRKGWKRVFGGPKKDGKALTNNSKNNNNPIGGYSPLLQDRDERSSSSVAINDLLPQESSPHELQPVGRNSSQSKQESQVPNHLADAPGKKGDRSTEAREKSKSSKQSTTKKKDSSKKKSRDPPADKQVSKSSGPRSISSAVSPTKKTREDLVRPFGRSSLTETKHGRDWVVEVSPAEWEADEYRWKYRVLVQRRELNEETSSIETPKSSAMAFTRRSLADFGWLEQALIAEFHGSLLLPLLSIYIGTPNVSNFTQNEVDPSLLRDWLCDVLNGIRGQGEIILMQDVDVMRSEAMEAFLYRNTDPLTELFPVNKRSSAKSALDDPWRTSPEKDLNGEPDESFVHSLWSKPLSCIPNLDELCSPPAPDVAVTPPRRRQEQQQDSFQGRLPLSTTDYTSRALGGALSLDMQDSFAASEPDSLAGSMPLHSQLLEAERELVTAYRRTAMSALDKLRMLVDDEIECGIAWKRFAIAMFNLYSFEKDLGSIRLDAAKGKERKSNHRKLDKKSVDELLRVMVKRKTERATFGLRNLDGILGAYIADLSSIGPALGAYTEAVTHMIQLKDARSQGPLERTRRNISTDSNDEADWQLKLKSTFVEVRKQIAGGSVTTETTETMSSSDGQSTLSQKKAFEERVIRNEIRLQKALTELCRATPGRCLRMAWAFYKKESDQASIVITAAHSMRTKINIIDRDKLASMIARHKREAIEDDKVELDLVRRILELGKNPLVTKALVDDGVQSSHSLLQDEALRLAQDRLGRWDADVALAIMTAIGAGADAEVRVDETTRDLRLVRKYAIGLRENLARCDEAIDILISIVSEQEELDTKLEKSTLQPKQLRVSRQKFLNSITKVFSSKLFDNSTRMPKSASASLSVLASAGVDLKDTAGWVDERHNLSCGKTLQNYGHLRDSRANELLKKLATLLKEYRQRVEGIESYVYMGCVGIQLEKFFSQKRMEALSAFEQKTDINTAIHIATRKQLPLLVSELETKREKVASVSHTDVKELKEMHLASKSLKSELAALAARRFLRAREASQERVVEILTEWARFEEATTNLEIEALKLGMDEVERAFTGS